MENPPPVPLILTRNNIYAVLSLINGGLAFLSNCVTLAFVIIPGLPFLCATVSGLLSLGALATGIAGLIQIRRNNEKGKGLAIAGLALGILGLVASCLIPLMGTALWAALGWQVGNTLLVPVD